MGEVVIFMNNKIDYSKSLEQLENDYWPKYDYETNLIKFCHEYRKIPLKSLSVENLRLLIGQNIGNYYLIPLALNILEHNPFAEGDFYPGDLLKNVVLSDNSYWIENKESWARLQNIIKKLEIGSSNNKELTDFDLKTKNDILKIFSEKRLD